MFPVLYDFGFFPLPSYFTMIAVGYIAALVLFWREARRQGFDPDDALDLGLWCLVWGIVGARILHVFADGFFMDYVHMCTDPFLVEGRDLFARPVSELQDLGIEPRQCTEDAQCKAAQWGYRSVSELKEAEAAGALDGCFAEPQGRVVGAICNEDTGFCHPEQDCFRWAKFWAGGLAFYGGFVFAILFAAYFTTRHRMGMLWAPRVQDLPRLGSWASTPVIGRFVHFVRYLRKFPQAFLNISDAASPGIALSHAFGRIGCYLAGCCFGAVHDGPLAVQFPGGTAAWRAHRKEHTEELSTQFQQLGEHMSLPVHPTQLYEVVVNLVIFGILYFVVRTRKRFHGQVFATLLMCYGLARFGLEFFRADDRGEWLFGLTTSQWIAVPLFVLGLLILWRGYRKSGEIIDDGASPPLGKPRSETVLRPVEGVMWGDKVVTPTSAWPENQNKLEARLYRDAAVRDATPPVSDSSAKKAPETSDQDTEPEDKDVDEPPEQKG